MYTTEQIPSTTPKFVPQASQAEPPHASSSCSRRNSALAWACIVSRGVIIEVLGAHIRFLTPLGCEHCARRSCGEARAHTTR